MGVFLTQHVLYTMTAGQAPFERQTLECHISQVRSTSDSQPTLRVEGKQQNALRGLNGILPLIGTVESAHLSSKGVSHSGMNLNEFG